MNHLFARSTLFWVWQNPVTVKDLDSCNEAWYKRTIASSSLVLILSAWNIFLFLSFMSCSAVFIGSLLWSPGSSFIWWQNAITTAWLEHDKVTSHVSLPNALPNGYTYGPFHVAKNWWKSFPLPVLANMAVECGTASCCSNLDLFVQTSPLQPPIDPDDAAVTWDCSLQHKGLSPEFCWLEPKAQDYMAYVWVYGQVWCMECYITCTTFWPSDLWSRMANKPVGTILLKLSCWTAGQHGTYVDIWIRVM